MLSEENSSVCSTGYVIFLKQSITSSACVDLLEPWRVVASQSTFEDNVN